MHVQYFRSNGFVNYDVYTRYVFLFERKTTEKSLICILRIKKCIKKLYLKTNIMWVECMFVVCIGTQKLLNQFYEHFKSLLEISNKC